MVLNTKIEMVKQIPIDKLWTRMLLRFALILIGLLGRSPFIMSQAKKNIKMLDCVTGYGLINEFIFSTRLIHTLFTLPCFNAQRHTYDHTLVYLCLLLVKSRLWQKAEQVKP